MTIQEIADEIYRELGASNDVSVPSIAFWLRNHIGNLNIKLDTDFIIGSDGISVTPDIDEKEKAIFKHLYNIYFYDTQIRKFLGAASQDIILEVSSDGATVRTVNKNELSKTYVQMKKYEEEELDKLISSYSSNDVSPLQVAGDDTIPDPSCANKTNYNRT